MKRKKPNRSYVPLSPQKLRRRTLDKRRLIWELTLCGNRLLGTVTEAIQLGVSCQSIRSIADNPVRGVGIADSNFAVGPVTLWYSSCSDVLLYYYGSLTPGSPPAVDLPNTGPHTTKHTFGKLAN